MSLILEKVSKRFGATQALAGVDLVLEPATIHSLVGENGAGKSTALGVLSGRVQPDSGQVRLDGSEVRFASPRHSMSAGIRTIYQELSVIPNLTAAENVFLGEGVRRLWQRVPRSEMADRFSELTSEFGFKIEPHAQTGSLSVADQQMVEILRAVVGQPRAVLFDEPTATLGPNEREALYRVLKVLRDRGVMVGLVSHNLAEVLELSDAVTVFRDGQMVTSGSEWTHGALTEAMVGHAVESGGRRAGGVPHIRPAVEVRGLGLDTKLSDVDLRVGAGEILGLAGLVGAGRSTVLHLLAGAIRPTGGSLLWQGQERSFPRSVRAARKLGITLVSEDRKATGLIPERSAASNIVLGDLSAVSRFGVLSKRRMEQATREAAEMVAFKESRLDAPTVTLSGGNQQKVLLARAIHSRPKLLLVDEPTRGVDIGAKAEIHKTISLAAAEGAAVVVVASEFEDLVEICDRVIVLWHGRVVAELAGEDLSTDVIVKKSFGPEASA